MRYNLHNYIRFGSQWDSSPFVNLTYTFYRQDWFDCPWSGRIHWKALGFHGSHKSHKTWKGYMIIYKWLYRNLGQINAIRVRSCLSANFIGWNKFDSGHVLLVRAECVRQQANKVTIILGIISLSLLWVIYSFSPKEFSKCSENCHGLPSKISGTPPSPRTVQFLGRNGLYPVPCWTGASAYMSI